jgi:hypothetical protein
MALTTACPSAASGGIGGDPGGRVAAHAASDRHKRQAWTDRRTDMAGLGVRA